MFKRCLLVFFLFICFGMGSRLADATVFKLNKIVPVRDIRLHSIKDSYSLSIPIPERWQVRRAVLKFSYVNSTALLPYKSRLVVAIDGIPLQQAVLDDTSAEKEMEVAIPGPMLKSGYHELELSVAQHSEKECEDPFAPELWTLVRLGEATLSIDYSLKPIPLRLSAIPKFITDPKSIPYGRINLVIGSLDEQTLSAASIVAGAVGARFQYRPVQISVSQGIVTDCDNIVIGTKKRLKELGVPRGILGDGPRVSIFPMLHPLESGPREATANGTSRRDNRYALIVISGESPAELLKASRAFSSMTFPFPQSQSMLIEQVDFPKLKPYQKADLVVPGVPVRFGDLGFSTHVFKGMNRQPVSLDFYLPTDVYIEPNQYCALSLHFGFSAAVRKDSTLRLELNGKPVSSIHLDNENGAFYENYKILIPAYMFRPGRNVISFNAMLVPLVMKRCQGFQDVNLFLTLFEDSIISFPKMPHWGKMPEIGYFFDSGFPFSRNGTCKDAVILLPEKTLQSVTAAMNLAAYLGQVNRVAPVDLKILFSLDKAKGREIILIGRLSKLPQEIIKKAPLVLTDSSALVSYPQIIELSGGKERSFWQKIEEKLEGYSRFFPAKGFVKNSVVKEKGVSLSKDTGIIMEFESPFSKGKSVLVWAATSGEALKESAKMLWSGGLRSMAHGDLVLFSMENKKEIHSLKVGPTYYTGSLSKRAKVDFWLRSYPWLFYGTLAVCFVILAFIFGAYLRWRRKKRLANEI